MKIPLTIQESLDLAKFFVSLSFDGDELVLAMQKVESGSELSVAVKAVGLLRLERIKERY